MTRPLLLGLCVLSLAAPLAAQPLNGDTTILEARDAVRKRDRSRLAAARATAQAAQHPLTPWVEYWDLNARLSELKVDEVEAFYTRWSGSYVEDRLRNDWLLELGRRRDWPAIARDYPRFRMNDDREVSCWWLLTEHLAGRDVRDAARSAWFAQRELDDGCNMLATAMVDGKRFRSDDVWRKARLSVEANRPAAAKAAIGLLGNAVDRAASDALENPTKYLLRETGPAPAQRQELRLLALMRLAASDSEQAATLLGERSHLLSPAQAAWAWAYIGRQAAFKLSADASAHYRRAWAVMPAAEAAAPGWSDETIVWGARSALRIPAARERWPLLLRQVGVMSPALQAEPTWAYWKARALQATARDGTAEGDIQRAEARHLLESIAGPLHFYGQLAAEDLGQPLALPPAPLPLSAAERDAARTTPGLARAMKLAELGLRDEARREWNFTLRGMADRDLQAAARLACDASDWQLCINTSDRTRDDIDVATRYPMPFANEIHAAAGAAGLEPAFVFGLIRQETRFMSQLRSSAGATGLMQLMPATARWVAKKVGMDVNPARPEQINDPVTNLRLGTSYLKMVLDDLSGSQALAAAAYNAGPGRPRRWREGPVLEAAAWAENIPFNETRDYVKKVLSNTSVYAAVLNKQPPVLKARLGAPIGPRDSTAPVNGELP
ncbi:transglycosylase SLT domain-containing protein [Aquabacterium sp.]|uniref:lytic transglycosylase domain-containing protein n=1 Tax=Aquabacterium sp. TaxID=1872578 RepID=UPI002D02549D|nr:transglycosylase SLT domain-containing protein [Aquabacterium sp.]HSW08208.1 transglycosylase SLT domain-containing protein [Aquabacterium sp.]